MINENFSNLLINRYHILSSVKGVEQNKIKWWHKFVRKIINCQKLSKWNLCLMEFYIKWKICWVSTERNIYLLTSGMDSVG